jgi:60 kDa SS-A/Ro ribonucleoprotein
MSKYKNLLTKNKIASATDKIIGREEDMSKNDGGGVSFKIGSWGMLSRFLNLGAESGTYYLSSQKHQYRNYDNILSCIKEDGVRVVNTLKEVSVKGLSHKNDHAIFVLALCFANGNKETKEAASLVLNDVCRTGTHILMFVQFVKGLRGFGRVVRNAINKWYLSKSTKDLAFQLSKYQNRDGWSHRDVFCLTHPSFGKGSIQNKIAQWSMGLSNALDYNEDDAGCQLLRAVDSAKTCANSSELVNLIKQYGLQREHIPTNHLNDTEIQKYMLPNLGATALIRNLGNMSKSGLLKPLSEESKFIIKKLNDIEFLRKGKIHPLSILLAEKTYSSGRGMLGKGSWDVNQNISDALEKAFFKSFDLVEPTNKNYFFGVDISGSMTMNISSAPISCHEVASVIALTMAKVEPYTFVGGFGTTFHDLCISAKDNLDSAKKKTQGNFGSTNPGSAIEYAINKHIDADVFVLITDNDINAGSQPSQLLAQYRKKMKKPNCKMIVVGLTASNFTIADPNDPLMLDIAGFSPDITSIITNFVKD